jgi:hypothetical protein
MPPVRPRLLVSVALLALPALSGCSTLASVRGGPVVEARNDTPYGGGEVSADVHIDVGPGGAWESEEAAEQLSVRYGPVGGAYLRATGLGAGTGGRAGFFAGGTSSDIVLLGSAQAQTGMHTLDGTAYYAVGGLAAFTFGFAVDRPEGDALARCRSATYVTFGAQGSFDYLTQPETFVPGAGLMIGVAGLDDAGSEAFRRSPADDCPE